jgi:hypothetical protein
MLNSINVEIKGRLSATLCAGVAFGISDSYDGGILKCDFAR